MGHEKAIIVALAAAAAAKRSIERGLPAPVEPEVGPSGKDGTNGVDGKHGSDGVGIDALCDLGGGQFSVSLTDGRTYDFRAPQGERGLRGDRGPKGERGESIVGPQGPKGDKGDKGDTGDTGAAGPVGPAGPRGEKGDKGEAGVKGDIGPMPRHEWDGTKLRFEVQPGQWGQYVDLRGPKGPAGRGGAVGGSASDAMIIAPTPAPVPPSSGVQRLTLIAAAPIIAYKVVTTDAQGRGIYANAGTAAHVDQVIGLAATAAQAGGAFEVIESGVAVNTGWSWSAGQPLFLGLNGDIVAAPVGVFSLQIGYAKSSTEVYVRIGRGVLRA